jgi:hypothetical protein
MNYKFEWKFKDGADHYEQLYLGCESLADAIQNWCIHWLAIENDEQVQPDDYCDFFTITEVEQLPIAGQYSLNP